MRRLQRGQLASSLVQLRQKLQVMNVICLLHRYVQPVCITFLH